MSSEVKQANDLAEIIINLHLVNDQVRPAYLFYETHTSDVRPDTVLTLVKLLYPRLCVTKSRLDQYWIYSATSGTAVPEAAIQMCDPFDPTYNQVRGEALGYLYPNATVTRGWGQSKCPTLYLQYQVELPDQSVCTLFSVNTGKSDMSEFSANDLQFLQAQCDEFSTSCDKLQACFILQIDAVWFNGSRNTVKQFVRSSTKINTNPIK